MIFVVLIIVMTRKAPVLSNLLSEKRDKSRGHPPEVVTLSCLFCFVSEQEKTTPPGSTENIVEEIGELGQTLRLWPEKSFSHAVICFCHFSQE